MELIAIFALIFGIIAASSFFLQAFKIERIHESRDISLPTYMILILNAVIWLFYGIYLSNLVIIIVHIIGVASVTSVIILYFNYKRKTKRKKK